MTPPIIGARTLAQLENNLGALEVSLDEGQGVRLQAASAIDLGFPHDFLARPMTKAIVSGGLDIRPR